MENAPVPLWIVLAVIGLVVWRVLVTVRASRKHPLSRWHRLSRWTWPAA